MEVSEKDKVLIKSGIMQLYIERHISDGLAKTLVSLLGLKGA